MKPTWTILHGRHLAEIAGLALVAAVNSGSAQLLSLQPGSAIGSFEYGVRILVGGAGGAPVFFDGAGPNPDFGWLRDPGGGGVGANFSAVDGDWFGWPARPIARDIAVPLAPGFYSRFVPRGPEPGGVADNFGPAQMVTWADNRGIWLGQWFVTDPKAPAQPFRGIDATVVEVGVTGDWTANADLSGRTLGLGLGFTVNLRAAGNYGALALTGEYQVWRPGVGLVGSARFNPVIFAADGPGGQPDMLRADFVSPNAAFLQGPNVADDLVGPYSIWAFSTLQIGVGRNPDVLRGDTLRFIGFLTVIADPEAGIDWFDIPPGEGPSYDFGSQFDFTVVPEPHSGALLALGLVALVGYRRVRSR